MKVKAKKDAFDKKKRIEDIFLHQDIMQCGLENLRDLINGKIVDIPDPKFSTAGPLGFMDKVEKIKKKGGK